MKRFNWLVLLNLFFVLTINHSIYAQIKATASSAQENYLPQKAVDGNMATRWGSKFLDNQWLMLDLGELKTISGLSLHWETAYAEHYKILLSKDANNWINVYETKRGDGKTDEIYFTPQQARFIKISCIKRATGWGNSIWEVKIKSEEDYPIISASSYKDKKIPSNIMDGNFKSFWATDKSSPQSVMIDLRKQKEIGGFQLNWGPDYAISYEILTSLSKNSWQKVYETETSNGKTDFAYINKTRARYIKIIAKKSNNKGFSLYELTLKGADEQATPEKYYEVLAEESPAGYFPKWVYKKQIFWTITGLEGAKEESLISQDGTVEPYKGSFSIMPYIYMDNHLVTAADCKVSQSLEKNFLPIPSVEWNYKGLILKQKMFTQSEDKTPFTFVIYGLKNNTSVEKTGNFYITLRPIQINPPWQHGSMPRIKSIAFKSKKNFSEIKVNSKISVILLPRPDSFGASYLNKSDIINYVAKDTLPDNKTVKDKEGLASCAVKYSFTLKPGDRKKLFFILPLKKIKNIQPLSEEEIKQGLTGAEKKWMKKLSRIEIDIPQKELTDVMKANISYILINRDKAALQPGPRNYNHSWMRDGSVMAAALLRTGHFKEVKDYLDWVTTTQKPSGEIPCILESTGEMAPWATSWKEWDGQGAYIFAIAEYYRFTKDKEFLKEKFPHVIKALEFLENLRKERLADKYKDTYFYGILPESNSHEGYFPAQHSLWDDFWALKGWQDGEYLAKVLGRKDLINWMKKEEDGLRENLLKDIELIQKKKNIKYIPGCFDKADFDATSTAISVWPTQQARYLEKKDLIYTLDRYYSSTFYPRLQRGLRKPYTPYEMRTATAYLMLGEKTKALNMVNYFLRDMRPRAWCHWAEVVHEDYNRPQYIGDMPHTWIGGIYVNLIRNLFVYEKDSSLILAQGIDENWLKDNKDIVVKNLPTYYGRINYKITTREGRIRRFIKRLVHLGRREKRKLLKFDVWGSIDGTSKIIFHIPHMGEIDYAIVNGKRIDKIRKDKIVFKKLPTHVVVYYKNNK